MNRNTPAAATARQSITLTHILNAPRGWWDLSHPWVEAFSGGNATCDCCGSELSRKALIDDEGNVWGVDCYFAATGRRAPNAGKADPPIYSYHSREGVAVHLPHYGVRFFDLATFPVALFWAMPRKGKYTGATRDLQIILKAAGVLPLTGKESPKRLVMIETRRENFTKAGLI